MVPFFTLTIKRWFSVRTVLDFTIFSIGILSEQETLSRRSIRGFYRSCPEQKSWVRNRLFRNFLTFFWSGPRFKNFRPVRKFSPLKDVMVWFGNIWTAIWICVVEKFIDAYQYMHHRNVLKPFYNCMRRRFPYNLYQTNENHISYLHFFYSKFKPNCMCKRTIWGFQRYFSFWNRIILS